MGDGSMAGAIESEVSNVVELPTSNGKKLKQGRKRQKMAKTGGWYSFQQWLPVFNPIVPR